MESSYYSDSSDTKSEGDSGGSGYISGRGGGESGGVSVSDTLIFNGNCATSLPNRQ